MPLRQMKRIQKRYQPQGAKGLISLSRGMPSGNKKRENFDAKKMEIVRGKYADYDATLAAEKLLEKQGA